MPLTCHFVEPMPDNFLYAVEDLSTLNQCNSESLFNVALNNISTAKGLDSSGNVTI